MEDLTADLGARRTASLVGMEDKHMVEDLDI